MTKIISNPPALFLADDPADGTDESLVEASRKDSEAFAILYDRHIKSVYRYLCSKVGNAADAEDLTSQVFLAALESLDRYPKKAGFRAWLFGIARRKTADFYRKRGRHVTLDESLRGYASDENIMAQVAHGQSLRVLAQVITYLNEDEQELLRLRFGGELSFAEIAGLMRMKESAVKMRLYRLIEHLQKAMETGHDGTK